MNSGRRRLRRQQLDSQLLRYTDLTEISPPPGGWIRSIREALGMSLAAFASRLGVVSASTAHQLEQSEVDGGISLKRLRTAADALGCDVVVLLVPRIPLTTFAEQRAAEKAKERLRRVGHTMAMEDQEIDRIAIDEITRQVAQEILDKGGSSLWE